MLFKISQPIIITVLLFSLSGCGGTVPSPSKNELRYAAKTKVTNEVFHANYQSLAKCWDERAEKVNIDFFNATTMNIYPELNMAEIFVRWHGNNYGILLELLKKNSDETLVNAYGAGDLGERYIPQWLGVLKDCEANVSSKKQ